MKILLIVISLLLTVNLLGNDTTKLYNPAANVEKDMVEILKQAKKENKHVMLQIGGNWCIWCYRFNRFVGSDKELKESLDKNFVVYHLNYSPENKNLEYLKKLNFPQRFGFPVMVILDVEGNRLHTQDSGLLEQGNTYNKDKVKGFFQNWAPNAVNEAYYRE